MEADIVEYPYSETDDDFHKGRRTYQHIQKAIIFKQRTKEFLVLLWDKRIYWTSRFINSGKNEFRLIDSDGFRIPTPQKKVKVIKKIELPDTLALEIMHFLECARKQIVKKQELKDILSVEGT